MKNLKLWLVWLLTSLCLLPTLEASHITPADWGSSLTGLWEFDTTTNPLIATVGNDLILVGAGPLTHTFGAYTGDAGVVVPLGSHFDCDHAIAGGMGNGGTATNLVNEYSLLFDVYLPDLAGWYSLMQTNATNSNDVDCAIRPTTGYVGIGTSGYSTVGLNPMQWHRVIISVDLGNFYNIYLDGQLVVSGGAQPIDDRFALEANLVKLFADDNGDDRDITVTTVAAFDRPLTAQEVYQLGTTPGAALDCAAAPTNIQVTPGGSVADVSWTANSTPNYWDLEYGPAGFTQGTGTNVLIAANDTPFTLGGLTAATNYELYLRGNCGTVDSTAWTGPIAFSTTGCTPPTNFAIEAIGPQATRLSWESLSGFSEWEIEYGPIGFATGSGTLVSGLSTEVYTLSGLMEATGYDVYVREVCNGTAGAFTGPLTFTTTTAVTEPDFGNALQFDGIDDIIYLDSTVQRSASYLALPTEQMTVSAWININSFVNYAGVIGFLQDNGAFERGWLLHTRSGGTMSFIMATDSSQTLEYSQQFPAPANSWFHIAVTYDGNDVRSFIDGVQVHSYPKTGAVSYADSWLVIGQYLDNDESYAFDGTIDEVSIWNRALNQTEILDVYCKNYQNISDLHSYYHFSEGIGDTVFNAAGPVNGVIDGATWTTSVGTVQACEPVAGVQTDFTAAQLASTDRTDYIATPYDPTFGATGDFSIDFRIKSSGWDGDPAIISDKDWNSGNNPGFVIAFNGNSIKVNAGSGGNRADVNGGLPMNDGIWHHVLATFDRDGNLELFLDGISQGTDNMGGDVADMNSPYTINIGQDGTGNYPSGFSTTGPTSEIAEVRLWDRVMGLNEVNACDSIADTDPLFSDLLAYWKMNDGADTIATETIAANDGIWQGNEAWTLNNNFPPALAAFTPNVLLSTVNFINQSSIGNYFWDFGDGSTSTAANPTHTYLSVGSFEVSLVVETACSSDTATQTIQILNLDNNLLNSLDLDGSDDYVEFAPFALSGTSDFTVELFVKSEGWSSDPSIIANKDWGSGGNPGFIIAGKSNSLTWKFNAGDGLGSRIDLDGGIINDGQWHHIAISYDHDDLKRLYHDGQLLDQTTTQLADISSTLPIAIGQDGTLSYGAFFDGQVAEVRIWSVALDSATVVDFLCGADAGHPNFADLVHYWKADEGSGTLVADGVGTNQGTYNGDWTTSLNTLEGCEAPIPANEIGAGNAVEFDGLDDWIDLSGADGNKVPAETLGLPDSTLTLECWVKPNTYTIWHSMVAFMQDNGSFEKGWDLETRGGNKFAFALSTVGSAGGLTYMETTNAFEEDKWHHVAGVYTGDTMKIYVNGILEATSTSQSGAIDYADSWLVIGMYKDDNEDFSLDGTVDEVRIWNIARSQEEIRADMCQKLEGGEEGLVAYYRLDNLTGEDVVDAGPNGLNGKMVNMVPAIARQTSGAALGDTSTYAYASDWMGASVSLTSDSIGNLTLDEINGFVQGVHLYAVNEFPNTPNGINAPAEKPGYFGTFLADPVGMTHRAIYDYASYPEAVSAEASLGLYNRPDASALTWFSAGATSDPANDQLLLSGIGTRREIAVGDFVPAPCPAPSAVLLDSVGFTTAGLSWTSTGVQFIVKSALTGTMFEDIDGDTISLTSVVLDSLMAAMTYDFYVQAICADGSVSAWTGPFSFTTDDPCPMPSNLSVDAISDTEATFSWDAAPTVVSWDIEWGPIGFTLGTGVSLNTTDNPLTLMNLPPNTDLEIYVRSACTDFSLESRWIGPVKFTTDSTTVGIHSGVGPIEMLRGWPNPTSGNFTVEITATQPLFGTEILLLNAMGQIVYAHKAGDVQSILTHQIPMEQLTEGVYTLKLRAQNDQAALRIIKR